MSIGSITRHINRKHKKATGIKDTTCPVCIETVNPLDLEAHNHEKHEDLMKDYLKAMWLKTYCEICGKAVCKNSLKKHN
jgi:hypothetical protein